MAGAHDPIDAIIRTISEAASFEMQRRDAINQTRQHMLAFGEAMAEVLSAAPGADVGNLGLRVRMVAHGTPAVVSSLITIESSPSIPDPDFDTRPGATALYLEALGDGKDRQHVEVRSNPGTMVLVSTSLERVRLRTDGVNGIGVDQHGNPLLVEYDYEKDSRRTLFTPESYLSVFVTELRIHLEHVAKFNKGLPG